MTTCSYDLIIGVDRACLRRSRRAGPSDWSPALTANERAKTQELFKRLGEWEASLETTLLWDESPRWWGDSAHIYDTRAPRDEPR